MLIRIGSEIHHMPIILRFLISSTGSDIFLFSLQAGELLLDERLVKHRTIVEMTLTRTH
jgi:hypothetical protein